jgi:hypothetical protein
MNPIPLFAQFDGDEIDGKRYAFGAQIDDSVDAGTRAVLLGMGRIATSPPAPAFGMPVDSGKPVADMTRPELAAAAQAAFAAQVADLDDDKLRDGITRHREQVEAARAEEQAKRDEAAAGNEAGSTPYADLKDKPLTSLRTADLVVIAEEENVSLVDASTNAQRVDAIEKARAAKG